MIHRSLLAYSLMLIMTDSVISQETFRLEERFREGYEYAVQSRVELSGTLTTPTTKDGKPKKVSLTGQSSIDYDERVLSINRENKVDKTIRIFHKVNLSRKVGSVEQTSTLRPEIRRVVQLRKGTTENPFSPDGPLTWAEIDLIRTDVFTPALRGLLPTRDVRIGDRWLASTQAIQELTDMEKIDKGSLTCRLDQITTLVRRRHARVSFSGTVRGTNEDGPNQQQLEGFFYFDLKHNHLSYLSLQGRHSLLNAEGQEMGRVEGRFVLSRQISSSRDLSDAELRRLTLEPNADNSRLLYRDEKSKVEFLHPRRWRVASAVGQQIMLDSSEGAGIVITLESNQKLPTANRFYQEARDWLSKQKANLRYVTRPYREQARATDIEHFTIEAEMSQQRFVMDYFVVRDSNQGATLAARLPYGKGMENILKEVEDIARSLRRR